MAIFTPNILLDMAVVAEAEGRAPKSAQDRWDANRRMEAAYVCALWMEKHGLRVAFSIGPFGQVDIKQGDKVGIPKGTPIEGGGSNRAGCTYTVTVRSIDTGYAGWDINDRPCVRNQRVVWSGRDSWRQTDAINVKKIG